MLYKCVSGIGVKWAIQSWVWDETDGCSIGGYTPPFLQRPDIGHLSIV